MPDITQLWSALALSPAAVLAALAMAFIAAFVRGMTGFGMAIILVPLLALIAPPTEAVVVGQIMGLLIGVFGLRTIVVDADRGSAIPIIIASLLGTPLGLWALISLNVEAARLGIAAVAVAAFVLVILPQRAERHPWPMPVTLATGFSAGLLSGFASMPGPPVVPYYIHAPVTAAQARASMMLVFLFTSVSGVIVAALMGLDSVRVWLLAALLFPAVWTGNALGSLAFGRISALWWRIAVAVILGIAGAAAIARAF